jgi:integrase
MSAKSLTLLSLWQQFESWMLREVTAGRSRPRTLDYYRHQVLYFLDQVGGDRLLTELVPFDLERIKTGWHSVQAVQRLFNWAVEMGLIESHPFKRVKKPAAGARQRILSRAEFLRLCRAAPRDFRLLLIALRHLMCRPQEVRVLNWTQLTWGQPSFFALLEYKSRSRRRDPSQPRLLLLDGRMVRMLHRLQLRRRPGQDHVFTTARGQAWTAQALRLRLRRLCERLGIGADQRGELVVCYTVRHTAATEAAANGVRDRLLAELLGHTTPRTTQRYLHPGAEHLAQAIAQATQRAQPRAG